MIKLTSIKRRMAMRASVRIELYETIESFYEAGARLDVGLAKIAEIFGKRRGGGKVIAEGIAEVRQALKGEGKAEVDALAGIFPLDEATIIGGAIGSDDPARGFAMAREIAAGKGRLSKAVVGAVSYPLVMIIGTLLGVSAFVGKIGPLVESMGSNVEFVGMARLMTEGGPYLSLAGPLGATVILGSIFGLFVSFPIWRGSTRLWAEKLMPWRMYKDIQGAAFLLALAGFMEGGMMMSKAIVRLHDLGTPWLKERLKRIRELESGQGMTFGEACEAAGFEFPTKRSVMQLASMSESQRMEAAIVKIARREFDKVIERMEFQSGILKQVLLGVAMAMGITFVGSYLDAMTQITDAMKQ